MAGQKGFWDIENRLAELSAEGDPLEKLSATVDFEVFRPILLRALRQAGPSRLGRPPFCPVLKFRMLVLQSLHGLSLERTAYMVRDRLSWMRFCRLGPGDRVPDVNTLWDFREALIKAKVLDKLFSRLNEAITKAGYLPMGGQIVDASLIAAPKQRNNDDEKDAIKAGKSADEIWPDEPNKARQKDTHARWTVKQGKAPAPGPDGKTPPAISIPVFGYKDHIGIDRRFGFIRPYVKYNAKSDKWFVRGEGGGDLEIARPTFLLDLANIRTGWLHFADGQAPQRLIDPALDKVAPKPDETFKRGFVVMAFSPKFFGGAVELASASIHVSNAIRDVYAVFEEQAGRTENRGKVPVIACTGSDAMKDKYGTNYRPKLELTKWVDRPAEFPDASPVEESEVWKGNVTAASRPAPAGHVPPPAAKPAPQPVYETDF